MKMANTVELKNKANELLRGVMKGEPVIITLKGKPAAALTPLTEDGLEDFMLENSASIRKKIKKAEDDIKAGRVMSLEDYLGGRK
ncbi:MAG: type II toxin-antitoxin system prevent-host-death family antitoxin [Nitrospinae bacterium]|nr:type II toxin-antitoxin system prevent-host-death family antitoxin [Nitrospinota bacterium]